MSAPGSSDPVEVIARLAAIDEELQALAVREQASLDQAQAQWAAEDEERAKAARRGDLGPEWQRLQGRIDLGETSVAAIVRGADDSPQAQVVMDAGRRNAEEFGRDLQLELDREADEAGQGAPPELFAGMAREVAELQQALAELAELTGRPLPPPAS